MNKLIKLLSFLLVINLLILGNLIIKQYNTVDLLPISYAQTAKHNNDNYNFNVFKKWKQISVKTLFFYFKNSIIIVMIHIDWFRSNYDYEFKKYILVI